ncbi:MAG: bile acid 7-alpha dehydratase [Spongiibacteraceae bacterium]|nr:bile acid 7-alpha dehydratase [Spongiibacteraceae bacterium]
MQSDLEQQIQRLTDIEAIKTLKYRYVKAMTYSDWDALEATLIESVETSYSDGKYTFNNREDVLNLLRSSHNHAMHNIIAYWHVTMPIIEITSDNTATGSWGMYHRYIDRGERNVEEEQFAFYEDEYLRTDEGWKISKTGYRRVMEQGFERGDIASLKFNATRFD